MRVKARQLNLSLEPENKRKQVMVGADNCENCNFYMNTAMQGTPRVPKRIVETT